MFLLANVNKSYRYMLPKSLSAYVVATSQAYLCEIWNRLILAERCFLCTNLSNIIELYDFKINLSHTMNLATVIFWSYMMYFFFGGQAINGTYLSFLVYYAVMNGIMTNIPRHTGI